MWGIKNQQYDIWLYLKKEYTTCNHQIWRFNSQTNSKCWGTVLLIVCERDRMRFFKKCDLPPPKEIWPSKKDENDVSPLDFANFHVFSSKKNKNHIVALGSWPLSMYVREQPPRGPGTKSGGAWRQVFIGTNRVDWVTIQVHW